MNTLQGDKLHRTTDPLDVSSVKTARLRAVTLDGDATGCVLTIQDSVDGLVWVSSTVTLGSITNNGVMTTVFDVDGVNFIRAKVTTVSTSASVIGVAIGTQQEV